jgi:hypothetical protein
MKHQKGKPPMKANTTDTKLDIWKKHYDRAEHELGIVVAFFVGLEQAKFPSQEQTRVISRCKEAIQVAQNCLRHAAEVAP